MRPLGNGLPPVLELQTEKGDDCAHQPPSTYYSVKSVLKDKVAEA